MRDLGYLYLTSVVLGGIPLLLLALAPRLLRVRGIRCDRLRCDLCVVAICLLPFMLTGAPVGLGLDYRT